MAIFRVYSRIFRFVLWADLITVSVQTRADRSILRSLLMNSSFSSLMENDQQAVARLEDVDWVDTALAERQTVVHMLSRPGDPTSLVQLPPLIIAGIVGGVALAAVAAAAVAFLGVAGLTVGLLWAFGVFNSHKDRRRKNDKAGACESRNPLDTNDPDCFSLRFNKIASYYPYHANLKKLEKAVVTGQEEISGLWHNAYMTSEHLENRIFGPGGTSQRPNSAVGLHHDVEVNLDASRQLQAVSQASIEGLFNAAMGMQDESEADVAALKTNLAASFSNLTEDANAVMERQKKSAELNSIIATNRASTVLRTGMTNLIENQNATRDSMVDTYKSQKSAIADVNYNKKILRHVLDDADETVGKLEKAVDSRFSAVSSDIEVKTNIALRMVGTVAEEQQRHAISALDLMAKDFSETTLDQVSFSKESWKSSSMKTLSKSKALADAIDYQLIGTLMTNQSNLIGNGSVVVTDAIGSSQSGLMQLHSDNQRTVKTIAGSTSVLSSDTSNATETTKKDATVVTEYIDDSLAGVKRRIAAYLNSVGESGDGLNSIVKAVGGAQSDARKTLTRGESEYTAEIASALNALGVNGMNAGQALQSFFDLLQSGNAKTNADVTRIIQSTLLGSKIQGAQLMDAADALGSQTGSLSRGNQNSMEALKSRLSGDMKNGLNELLQRIGEVQSAGKWGFVSAKDGFRSGTDRWIGQAEKTRLTADKMLDGMRVGSQEQASLTYRYLQVRDGDTSSVAELAKILSGGDDAVANAIQSELIRAQRLLGQVSTRSVGEDQIRKIVESARREIERKKSGISGVTNNLLGGENRLVEKTKLTGERVGKLWNEAQTYTEKSDSGRNSINTQILSRLADLGMKANSSITGFSVAAGGGMVASANNAMSSILQEIMEKARLGLKTIPGDSQRGLQDRTSGLVVESKTLDHNFDAMKSESAAANFLLQDFVSRILNSLAMNSSSASLSLKAMTRRLEDMRITTREGIRNFTTAVREQILSVPLMVIAGTAALERDMQYVSSDISDRIRKTREMVSTARSEEESAAALRGLEVLNQLQAVQQGVYQADKSLRVKLARQQNISVEDDMHVTASLGIVLGALSGMNVGIDSDLAFFGNTRKTFELSAREIWDQLGVLVNTTGQELTASTAKGLLAQSLLLSEQQRRLNRSSAVTADSAEWSTNRTEKFLSSNAGQVGEISQLIAGTQKVFKTASVAQGEQIDQILDSVNKNAIFLKTNLSRQDEDVLTRIALVRQAMASFLSLWNEFVSASDARHFAITVSDREFLTAMETDMKRELIRGESFVRGTGNSLNVLKSVVKSVGESQTAFERSFAVDRKSLVEDLDDINNRRNKQMMKAFDQLADAVNLQNSDGDSRLDSIDALLDDFARIVGNRT